MSGGGFSAHAAGRSVSPAEAYRGLSPALRLFAAVIDSVLWDDPAWAAAMAAWLEGEDPRLTSSWAQQVMAEHGWADASDLYDAAALTRAQEQAVALFVAGASYGEINAFLGTQGSTSRVHVHDAMVKLRSACGIAVEEVAA